MTATEVQVRYELMQRLLGPTTGRLEAEFLNPFTWRCFSIMARRQAFKPLPGVMQEAVGGNAADLDIQYEGPLARAQRTIEITAQDRVIAFLVGFAAQVAPFAPEAAQQAIDMVKIRKMARDRGDITGLPSDSLASDEELDAMKAQRDEAVAKQQKQQEASMAAEAMGKAAPLIAAVSQKPPGQAKAA